jgi:O6-methylguanine-DNA--protein-cysteine methyltransferase
MHPAAMRCSNSWAIFRRSARTVRAQFLVLALSAALSGCANLSAVGNFAQESSLISANQALLDDTDAQAQAREYGAALHAADDFGDPASKAFTDRLSVTHQASSALQAYMTVLAQLSAGDTASVSTEVASISTAVGALNPGDPSLKPRMDAAASLSNLLLNGLVRKDLRQLIQSAAAPVDIITLYLADQAQITSNTYSQAIAVSNRYWGSLTTQSTQDIELCRSANLCKAVYALAGRARASDNADLAAKAAAADAAATAFKKIRSDHAALAAHTAHLDEKELIAQLKTDEPSLLAAIQSVHSLRAR